MESNFARENLSLPTMDKVTVLSIGHGQMTEKSFYELLQLNSVRVLYLGGGFKLFFCYFMLFSPLNWIKLGK